HRRKESQLRQICGYSGDPVAYQQLIELLERRLKLIARRDPVRKTWHGAEESSFMLTHDFLVPSIRAWVKWNWAGRRQGERCRCCVNATGRMLIAGKAGSSPV
ncbi:MAG: hypothetical protein WCK86_21455, partial [Planctomycetia bacterium]